MKEVQAIILAGGEGKRMGDVTKNIQKCLLPIDGEPIIYHILEELVKAFGSVDIAIAVSHQENQVKEYIDKIRSKVLSITYVPHKKASGTYGAYISMENCIKGSFVGLPGDVVARAKAYESVFNVFQKSSSDVAITLSPNLKEADSHGIARIRHGIVAEYIAVPPGNLQADGYLREIDIISGNRLFFSLLRDYPSEDLDLSTTFAKAVTAKREIAAYQYDEEWIHVAYMDDLKKSIPWKR